jgi:hypothetical protein
MEDGAPRVLELEKQFPRWSIWVSHTGYWWAALRKELAAVQRRAGCLSHLRASDYAELVDLLTEQEDLARRAGAPL